MFCLLKEFRNLSEHSFHLIGTSQVLFRLWRYETNGPEWPPSQQPSVIADTAQRGSIPLTASELTVPGVLRELLLKISKIQFLKVLMLDFFKFSSWSIIYLYKNIKYLMITIFFFLLQEYMWLLEDNCSWLWIKQFSPWSFDSSYGYEWAFWWLFKQQSKPSQNCCSSTTLCIYIFLFVYSFQLRILNDLIVI